jgi:hypothetical protein
VPGRVRLGDIDADGFPELLMSIKYQYGSTNQEYIETTLYKSDLCTITTCSAAATTALRRYFDPDPKDYEMF